MQLLHVYSPIVCQSILLLCSSYDQNSNTISILAMSLDLLHFYGFLHPIENSLLIFGVRISNNQLFLESITTCSLGKIQKI